MLHPSGLLLRRQDPGPGAPEWVGIGIFLVALALAGWMVVSCFGHRAWPMGLVGCLLFGAALFVTVANLFPEHRP